MQPLHEDLVLIQDEIREFFGWDLDSDYSSAISLLEECSNPEPVSYTHLTLPTTGSV